MGKPKLSPPQHHDPLPPDFALCIHPLLHNLTAEQNILFPFTTSFTDEVLRV